MPNGEGSDVEAAVERVRDSCVHTMVVDDNSQEQDSNITLLVDNKKKLTKDARNTMIGILKNIEKLYSLD